ncbi:hypothetical protein J6590_061668 [Homalodisca vitripennis]|nr:hypothetical protein J6590_061668 [Homalodisca vitripennis]
MAGTISLMPHWKKRKLSLFPSVPVRADVGRYSLKLRLPTAFNPKRAPHTPTVIIRNKLDVSIHTFTLISRHYREIKLRMRLNVHISFRCRLNGSYKTARSYRSWDGKLRWEKHSFVLN